MDIRDFVLTELSPPPRRVLEVGCGRGELAWALARGGYAVLAIDPEAPDGPIFRRSTIEELQERGLFDAVVASRSLHHVADLNVALDKIVSLLVPGGVIVVDELAWERLDPRSAREVGILAEEWRQEHDGLHTSKSMLSELDKRFGRRSFSWEPYLYRERREAVDEERERELIRVGRLQATGFRYVGRVSRASCRGRV